MAQSIKKSLQIRGVTENEVRLVVQAKGPVGSMFEYGFKSVTSWLCYLKEFMSDEDLAASSRISLQDTDSILDQLAIRILRKYAQVLGENEYLRERLQEEESKQARMADARKLEALRLLEMV